MNKCEYCKSDFRNELILKKHQKTAKYCLKKQTEIIEELNKINNLELKLKKQEEDYEERLRKQEQEEQNKYLIDISRHIYKDKDKATKLIKMIKPVGIITPKTVYDFVNRECADLEKTDDKKKYDKMIELYEGMLAIIQLIKMVNGV